MALAPRLDLRQQQTLVMTPQLQQAIKLLQMSNLELASYIEEELEKNPLLDREDDALESINVDEYKPDENNHDESLNILDNHDGIDNVPLDISDNNHGDDIASALQSNDYDVGDNNFALSGWETKNNYNFDDNEQSIEQTLSNQVSLRDFIVEQITIEIKDPIDRMVALHLLDMLDISGYLKGDIKEVATLLGCSTARVEKVLSIVQEFEPSGIFSRTLGECLAHQLKEKNRLDPYMQKLLENLELLGARKYEELKKICGVDAEDLEEMVEEIKNLNPRPTSSFENLIVQPIIPDILMRAKSDGGWTIELNSATLPRLLINNHYCAEINSSASSKEAKSFINEKLNSANWIINALQQRANTILKATTEIIKRQEDFFNKGVEHLKPLVLKEIADAIEMHESTVSRVTTNKYMATSRGVFELKYFFTQSIAGTNGESHSAEAVRHKIKALIDAEKPEATLSDDALVDILKKEGVEIARRTVAKYREAMNIGSSVQRRRDKKVQKY